jgi:hypothetical protein
MISELSRSVSNDSLENRGFGGERVAVFGL